MLSLVLSRTTRKEDVHCSNILYTGLSRLLDWAYGNRGAFVETAGAMSSSTGTEPSLLLGSPKNVSLPSFPASPTHMNSAPTPVVEVEENIEQDYTRLTQSSAQGEATRGDDLVKQLRLRRATVKFIGISVWSLSRLFTVITDEAIAAMRKGFAAGRRRSLIFPTAQHSSSQDEQDSSEPAEQEKPERPPLRPPRAGIFFPDSNKARTASTPRSGPLSVITSRHNPLSPRTPRHLIDDLCDIGEKLLLCTERHMDEEVLIFTYGTLSYLLGDKAVAGEHMSSLLQEEHWSPQH